MKEKVCTCVCMCVFVHTQLSSYILVRPKRKKKAARDALEVLFHQKCVVQVQHLNGLLR